MRHNSRTVKSLETSGLARSLLLGAVFTAPMAGQRIGPFAITDVLTLAAFLACVASGGLLGIRITSWQFTGILFLALAYTMTSVSGHSGGVLVASKLLILFSIWFSLLRTYFDTPNGVRLLLNAFLYGTLVSAVVAIVLGTAGGVDSDPRVVPRASGLSGNPNALGGIVALAAPIALSQLSVRRPWTLAFLPVLAYAALVSESASGMACGLFGCLILLVLNSRRLRTNRVLLWGVGLVALLWMFGVVGASGPTTWLANHGKISAGGDGSTLVQRITTIRVAWAQIQRQPFFGVGFDDTSGGTNAHGTLVHNFLVRSWYQGGVFLLLAVAIFLVAGALALWRQSSKSAERNVVRAVYLTMFVFAMSGPVLYERWIWFAMAIATVASVERDHVREMDPTSCLIVE